MNTKFKVEAVGFAASMVTTVALATGLIAGTIVAGILFAKK